MAKKQKYIQKRGEIWEFRRRVPTALVDNFGQKEFFYSLGTGSAADIKRRYADVLQEVEQKLSVARGKTKEQKVASLDGLDVEWEARRWYKRELEKIAKNDFQQFYDEHTKKGRIIDLGLELTEWKSGDLLRYGGDLHRYTDRVLIYLKYPRAPLTAEEKKWEKEKEKERAKSIGKAKAKAKVRVESIRAHVDKNSDKYQLFAELIRKGLVHLLEEELIRLGVQIKKTPTISLFNLNSAYQQSGTLNHGPSHNSKALEWLIEEYFKEPIREKITNKKTLDDMRTAFDILIEKVGSKKQIRDITRQDFKYLRDILVKMPTNARKLNRTKNMSLEELVADAKKHGRRIMKPVNVNKRLSSMRSLMQYAMVEGFIDKNPVDGVVAVDFNPVSKKDLRNSFSLEQLRVIFSSKAFHKSKPCGNAIYWVSLLAFLHGFRMEEILQLRTSDIISDKNSKVVYFDIHNKNGNFLKNPFSLRKVPVNPEMHKLGFSEFLKSVSNKPNSRLFPEVVMGKAVRYSKNFSPKYSRYLEQIGAKTEKTSFHSFRHTFRDVLRRADISSERVDALGGWNNEKGANRNYGDGQFMSELEKEMNKFAYPELDLSHLYV